MNLAANIVQVFEQRPTCGRCLPPTKNSTVSLLKCAMTALACDFAAVNEPTKIFVFGKRIPSFSVLTLNVWFSHENDLMMTGQCRPVNQRTSK